MINKLHKTERKRNSYRSRFRALKIRMRLGYGLFPSFVLLCVHLLRFLGICMLKISFWRLYRSRFRALKIRMRLGYGLFPSFVLLCVHLLRFLGICMLKISFWRLQRTDLTFVANQLSMCSESTLTCSESTLTCSDLQRNGFVAKRPDTS